MTDAERGLCGALGHTFADPRLLLDALTHSSLRHEKPAAARTDNDRLEFLGDAILQWAVSALLWERFPDASAGELTRRRADLVCEDALARIAREFGFGPALRLGRGEERSGGRDKSRLLASAFEAVIAALYLDGGRDVALSVCRSIFHPLLGSLPPGGRDFKTRVQETLQGRGRKAPSYDVQSASGPDHARIYRVSLTVDGEQLATGEGRSKLEAEQAAAERALSLLDAPATDRAPNDTPA